MIVKDSELEIFVACLKSLTRAEQIDSQGPAVPAARGESFATMIPVRDPSSQQGAVRMSCFFFIRGALVLWCSLLSVPCFSFAMSLPRIEPVLERSFLCAGLFELDMEDIEDIDIPTSDLA